MGNKLNVFSIFHSVDNIKTQIFSIFSKTNIFHAKPIQTNISRKPIHLSMPETKLFILLSTSNNFFYIRSDNWFFLFFLYLYCFLIFSCNIFYFNDWTGNHKPRRHFCTLVQDVWREKAHMLKQRNNVQLYIFEK